MADKEVSTYSIPKMVERKILKSIELKKQLEEQEAEIKAELKRIMEEHNVYSLQSDNYMITLATRNSFRVEDFGKIDKGFLKEALDTTKVGNHDKLYGEPPTGVIKTETKYITWRDRRGTSKK